MRKVAQSLTAVAIAATALLSIGSGAALAAPSATPASPTQPAKPATVVKVPLTISGVNEAVAKSHGFEVRTDPATGRKYSVKPGQAQPQLTTTTGDCGTAFISIASKGGLEALVYTGWDLTTSQPSFYFYWQVKVTDAAGTGERHWRGFAPGYSWDQFWDTTHSVGGTVTATVSNGFVELYDGTTCIGFHPTESTTL